MLRRLSRNIHWDSENKTLYVQRRSTNVSQLIVRYRRELEASPEQVATRYCLASCLYAAGQIEEAQSEWAQVAASSEEWSIRVAETQEILSQKPNEASTP